MAEVSIILPCRDAADTLPACLESIRRQRLPDFEVLCIDDHSRDETRRLLAGQARRDSRFRLLINRGHGLVDALNTGLARANGRWIARMDADDRMHPERLALQLAFLRRHPAIDLLGCGVRITGTTTRGMAEYARWLSGCLTHADIEAERYVENPLPHPTWFAPRQFFRRFGYRKGDFPEDYELVLRALAQGARMARLPEILLDWHDHPARTSRTDPRCSRDAFDRLRQAYLAADPRLHDGRPLAFWGAGRATRRRLRPLLDQEIRPDWWVDIDPRKLGQRIAGTPVQAPTSLLRRTPAPFVLVLVTVHGARARIARWLEEHGLHRGDDYLCVG